MSAVKKSLKLTPVLKQSNKLTRARYSYKMTWPETKIWAVVAAQARASGETEFETNINALCALAHLDGFGPRKYTAVAQFLTDLTERTAQFVQVNPETKAFKFASLPLFAYASYEGNGKVVLKINPFLLPHLTNLTEHFTVIDMEEFLSLKSSCQGRLYMIASSCARLWSTEQRTISIPALARMMGIPYKEGEDAQALRDVRRCWKALQKKTKLFFSVTPIREGRKITSVRFDHFKDFRKITKPEKT